jgi:hypothetical protein
MIQSHEYWLLAAKLYYMHLLLAQIINRLPQTKLFQQTPPPFTEKKGSEKPLF